VPRLRNKTLLDTTMFKNNGIQMQLRRKIHTLLPFTNEVLNTIVSHDVYSFLDGYSRYHQISIALRDRCKIAFVINWGAFTWVVITNKNHVVCN